MGTQKLSIRDFSKEMTSEKNLHRAGGFGYFQVTGECKKLLAGAWMREGRNVA